jgi:uncharacterized membrane protein YqaE (UPF0057 family)
MDNMKKITTQFLTLLFMVSVSASVSAASLPAPASEPAPASVPAGNTTKSDPDQALQSGLEDFKNLSKSEKKSRMKEVKKAIKAYKAERRKTHMDDDARMILAIIFAILIPPVGVLIKEQELTINFWIALALCLLSIITFVLWIIPVVFALLVVFDVI